MNRVCCRLLVRKNRIWARLLRFCPAPYSYSKFARSEKWMPCYLPTWKSESVPFPLLAPFYLYHLLPEISFPACKFADCGDRTPATCVASKRAIHSTIATQVFICFFMIEILFSCFHEDWGFLRGCPAEEEEANPAEAGVRFRRRVQTGNGKDRWVAGLWNRDLRFWLFWLTKLVSYKNYRELWLLLTRSESIEYIDATQKFKSFN